MPLLVISILLQVALVVHIVKTGRNTTWIWIVMMLPVAGGIAYLLVEVLPSLSQSRTARTAKQKASQTVNPLKQLRDVAKNYNISDTVENTLALAEELEKKNMFEESVKLYQKCLKGSFEFDPDILHKLASAQFYASNFVAARSSLDVLIEKNPNYKNADAHLLYARCLDELNETDAAMHEYQALSEYYTGPEANYRFALMLINLNRGDEARHYLEAIMERAEQSPPHYAVLHKEWLSKTKNLIKTC